MTEAEPESNARIFISYRQLDSAYPAGWLFDRLAERFGPEQVFKDVNSIELGADFVEVITDAVGSCDVLLALIGRKWLRITGRGRTRRLDDPNDFVRLEIEAALKRKVLLIPILVDGAVMPRAEDLPPSIAPLVRRQALELSPQRFSADTANLLNVMERTLSNLHEELPDEELPDAPTPETAADEHPGAPPPAPSPARTRRSFRISRRAGVAAAAVLLVAAASVAVVIQAWPDGRDSPAVTPTTPASSTTPPPLGGPGAPIVLAHRGGDENYAWQTLPTFEQAAKIGAAVETDVRWTKDGVAVLVHDPGTTPGMECTGGSYVVADTAWPVLRDRCRSSAGASTNGKRYGIPTFADAASTLSQIPGAQIYPEVKIVQTRTQARQFLGILANVRMIDRAVVTSFMPDELAKIRDQATKDGMDVRTMLFVSRERKPVAELVGQDLWAVAVEADVATAEYVKAVQDEGLKVMIWTVNTPAQWELTHRLNADLVLTDKPAAYGRWAKDR